MFGNKLRSWMEAVRPKKKQQQRKEKNTKNAPPNSTAVYVTNLDSVCNVRFSENETKKESAVRKSIIGSECRYSGTNLSSPESAYSTGYSTDGTSPGAPPEYYVNIRTGAKYIRDGEKNIPRPFGQSCPGYRLINNNAQINGNCTPVRKYQLPSSPYSSSSKKLIPKSQNEVEQKRCNVKNVESGLKVPDQPSLVVPNGKSVAGNSPSSARLPEPVVTSTITSPRQRNRIRTNPWLPGNSLSPGASSITLHPLRQEQLTPSLSTNPSNSRISTCQTQRKSAKHVFSVHCKSLSSSSCSSLSDDNTPWGANLVQTHSRLEIESDEDDEDDCTLNEMMGKYDESYIYEKETDILSDSDPTDCETDIDTGQDGGDEGETTEREFDFIDNGSLKELGLIEKEIKNTGHCIYFNYEGHIRQASRRKTIRKSQKTEHKNINHEKRKKSSSFKKRPRYPDYVCKPEEENSPMNGSRSAGATPISIRKTKRSSTKHMYDDHQKKRSNSVSYTETINLIDKRDIEAEKKYKELIVEAEHILMTMKTNGFSPRRLPTPTNKRVEILRNGESPVKSDAYLRNRLIEDTSNLHLSNCKIPSNAFTNTMWSPKKNHVVNFINNSSNNNSSRHCVRRELENRHSPLETNYSQNTTVKKKHLSPKLCKKSPKFRKKISKTLSVRHDSSTSEDEMEKKPKRNHIVTRKDFLCPQSEPVKRKNYFDGNKILAYHNCKQGLPNQDSSKPYTCNSSAENLRQQVLLNTIANLKRSLEDQSASLKQVCQSSQNINV